MFVIKRDGSKQKFDDNKIISAVNKSAERAMIKLTKADYDKLLKIVKQNLPKDEVNIKELHLMVENALDEVSPQVAKAYRDYRNYKAEFKDILQRVIDVSDGLLNGADHSNANSDSELVTTKRSLIYKALSKELYKNFFLTPEELRAINEGYIYIHDIGDRSTTMNCCLFDAGKVLQGGFDMEGMHYNEPTSISSAMNVLCDVMSMAGGSQYGGETVPEIDTVLEPYVEKSYKKYCNEYDGIYKGIEKYSTVTGMPRKQYYDLRNQYAMNKVKRDLEQGFQSLEYNLNTVASSRGDFTFTTLTFGLDPRPFGKLVSETILKVRQEGQGKEGFKKPAIFPKLVFLYDKDWHAEGRSLNDLFLKAIECSSKAQYPDYLSLSGDGYVAGIYKKYTNYEKRWYLGEDNKVRENPKWIDCIISPMGKRKLSPFETF